MGHLAGVGIHALADEQPLKVELPLSGPEVARDQLLEADVGTAEGGLARVPVLDDGVVEAVLAAEVVRDELLVHPGALGDRTHTRASPALGGELGERRIEQRLARPLGVTLSLLWLRSPTWGRPDSTHAAAASCGSRSSAWSRRAPTSWLGLVSGSAQAAQGLGMLAVPFSFVSSAFVPIETMPALLRAFAGWQPLTFMINAWRGLVLGDPITATFERSLTFYVSGSLLWTLALLLLAMPLTLRAYRRG
jgi:hypothetical protein